MVNRDGGRRAFPALRSLEAQQRSRPLDRRRRQRLARPPSASAWRARLPEARVVSFSENLGFAGAANEGIVRTRSPFVLLVNNDAVLAPDYVARLAARLALDEGWPPAQGLVLTADGSRIDSAGLCVERRGRGACPALRGAGRSARRPDAFEVVRRLGDGGALPARGARSASRRQGEVFDRSFFAYYEDVDLSLRLARAGWRFACDPAARGAARGLAHGVAHAVEAGDLDARNRWRTLFRNFDHRLCCAAQRARACFAPTWPTRRSSAGGAPLLLLLIWASLVFFGRSPAVAAGAGRSRAAGADDGGAAPMRRCAG